MKRCKQTRIVHTEKKNFISRNIDIIKYGTNLIKTDTYNFCAKLYVIQFNFIITGNRVRGLLQYKSEQAVKAAGKMAIEGKEYIVRDGDIMHFLFNV